MLEIEKHLKVRKKEWNKGMNLGDFLFELSSFFLFQKINLLVWYHDDVLSPILFWGFILYNDSGPFFIFSFPKI